MPSHFARFLRGQNPIFFAITQFFEPRSDSMNVVSDIQLQVEPIYGVKSLCFLLLELKLSYVAHSVLLLLRHTSNGLRYPRFPDLAKPPMMVDNRMT